MLDFCYFRHLFSLLWILSNDCPICSNVCSRNKRENTRRNPGKHQYIEWGKNLVLQRLKCHKYLEKMLKENFDVICCFKHPLNSMEKFSKSGHTMNRCLNMYFSGLQWMSWKLLLDKILQLYQCSQLFFFFFALFIQF